MKRCIACGVLQDETEFYRNGGTKPGRSPRCKSCIRSLGTARREANALAFIRRGGPGITERRCSGCKVVKPVDEFYLSPTTREGVHNHCKDCCKTSAKASVERRDPETLKRQRRSAHLKGKFGLTMDEFDAMVEAQRGACAVCGRVLDQLVVDHDHETGEVRELLCATCNAGIGMFGEDPDVIRAAIAYLERHKAAVKPPR